MKKNMFRTWLWKNVRKPIRKWLVHLFMSKKYFIIQNPLEVFEVVEQISPARWVVNDLPEVYKYQKDASGKYYVNEMNILSMKDAIVSHRSNIVLTPEGCYWEKAYRSDFSMIKILDVNVLKYDSTFVEVRKYDRIQNIKGKVICLTGVQAHIWAHFIIQYLPKLYYAGDHGYLDSHLTLLTPKYEDEHLRIIINDYIDKFSDITRIEAEDNVGYRCEELIYIPQLSLLTDHSNVLLPSMSLFTPEVGAMLKEHLIDAFVAKLNQDDLVDKKVRKIYVIRRGTYRALVNYPEMEEFFTSLGFTLVNPGNMSFLEKIEVFHNADFVVGPLSAGFINTLFCKPGTKVLPIALICRTQESYMNFIQTITGIDLLYVTGTDSEPATQTDYYVPIEKVKAAYEELMAR